MKFGFNRPSGFREEDNVDTHTYPQTTEAYQYYKLTYEPKGSGELKMIIRDFPTILNLGPGPLTLGKLASKSTKLGKLVQKKKEQVIYILTRLNLKFELNIWKIKRFIYNTQ